MYILLERRITKGYNAIIDKTIVTNAVPIEALKSTKATTKAAMPMATFKP